MFCWEDRATGESGSIVAFANRVLSMSIPVVSSINPAVHARQTALLYRNASLGQLITVLAATPITYLGYISRPGPIILLWLFCMFLAAYLRFRLSQRYRAVILPDTEALS